MWQTIINTKWQRDFIMGKTCVHDPISRRILRQIVNVAKCNVNGAMVAICGKILCKTGHMFKVFVS